MITKAQAVEAVALLMAYMEQESALNPPVAEDWETEPPLFHSWSQETPHIDDATAWVKSILQAARKNPCGGCILCCS